MKCNEWLWNAIRVGMLGAVFTCSFAGADETANEEDGFKAIEAKIRTMAPNATMIAISETPIEGLLQVQVNNEIVYATGDAKYLLTGRIIDMDTKANLTDQAKASVRKGLLEDLDASEQISFSPENPVHELMVFTDIDCGYCRKLHSQIDEYMAEGIAIHYMAYPRAGVGSNSYDKFVSVWCANDQKVAMTEAKLGNEPEILHCENPVEAQFNLGRDLGVTGTPALVMTDGTLIPGYMPPKQLRARLEQLEAQVAQVP